MRTLLGLAMCVTVAAAACKTVREELPTQSETSDSGPVAGGPLIPPAPTATPTPVPTPLPPDAGDGGDDGFDRGAGDGPSGSCGDPTPPAISRVNVKVYSSQPSRLILDATPLVGPNRVYCAEVGYTDGRSFCPVRPPGHPEREACEAIRVGTASDTGRTGPTWFAGGQPCQDGGAPACRNHPDNQYLVYAYGSGTFKACVEGGVCGQISVP